MTTPSTTIDLKGQVQQAIREEWPAFAAAHPRLAAVVDEAVLVEGALTALGEDPDYQTTMDQAAAAGIGAQVVGEFVSKIVARWLRQLV